LLDLDFILQGDQFHDRPTAGDRVLVQLAQILM